MPATNQRISTLIETKSGMLSFQDYMERLRGTPEVTGVRFSEIDQAVPAPGVLEAINDASMIVLAPSNPFLSIEPILAVAGVRHALRTRR